MTLDEFRNVCRGRPELKVHWSAVEQAAIQLYPAEIERGILLQERKELGPNQLMRLKVLRQEYADAFTGLRDACAECGVHMPFFTYNNVCEIFRS